MTKRQCNPSPLRVEGTCECKRGKSLEGALAERLRLEGGSLELADVNLVFSLIPEGALVDILEVCFIQTVQVAAINLE